LQGRFRGDQISPEGGAHQHDLRGLRQIPVERLEQGSQARRDGFRQGAIRLRACLVEGPFSRNSDQDRVALCCNRRGRPGVRLDARVLHGRGGRR
jgi:hypothetical protein